MEKAKVWSRLFFASLLLSFLFNAIDTGSDILIMFRYYYELYPERKTNSSNVDCGGVMAEQQHYTDICVNKTESEQLSIQCIPTELQPASKFGYTLFFLLVPWPFFIYEFFTSR